LGTNWEQYRVYIADASIVSPIIIFWRTRWHFSNNVAIGSGLFSVLLGGLHPHPQTKDRSVAQGLIAA